MSVVLKELIEFLSEQDPNGEVPVGIGEPMSYRGCYHDLSFEPVENTTFGEMLKHAESALGQTFQGYKGGDFTMGEYTDCYIAPYGQTGDQIGPVILEMWSMFAAL